MDSFQKAKFIAGLAQEKKASDILIMDMRKVMSFVDFFVVCSVDSYRQSKTVADYIVESTKKNGFNLWHTEGYQDGKWILLDYGDNVANIFVDEVRKFYELERLWRDVPIKKISEAK